MCVWYVLLFGNIQKHVIPSSKLVACPHLCLSDAKPQAKKIWLTIVKGITLPRKGMWYDVMTCAPKMLPSLIKQAMSL